MGSPARPFDRNRRAFLARAAALCATGFASACFPFPPVYRIRYRLTLHVVAAGRDYSGASVTEVQISMSPRWMPGGGSVFTRSRGNAATVVLGDGRTVTALRRGYSNASAPGDRFVTYDPWSGWDALTVLSRQKGEWDGDRNPLYEDMSTQPPDGVVALDNSQLPVLVTLARGADPGTLRIVDPDNPQAILGERVTRIFGDIALTRDEPLGEPIDRIFPWLAPDLAARRSYTPVAQIPGGRMGKVELDPTDFQYRTIKY